MTIYVIKEVFYVNQDFKNQEMIIRKFANEYNKSKIIELHGLDVIKNDLIRESVAHYMDSENKYTYYYSLQTKIDSVLEKLNWECRNFIKNEFFTSNYKNNWWMNYYSRSTYYRLKKKCMNEFLGLLYA